MDKGSESYEAHAAKYQGREDLMDATVPILDCKWNDVIHFSSLDPSVILKELIKIDPDLELKRRNYYRVHVDEVKAMNAVVFSPNGSRSDGFSIREEEVCPLSRETYQELKKVPLETIEYWKKAKSSNNKLLWFAHVPHVLIKGEFEVKDLEVLPLNL